MKVIFVSRSSNGKPTPFIKEQADVLVQNHSVSIEHFFIRKGGAAGYFHSILQLHSFTKKNKPDLIHVHYGLSALAVCLSKLLFFENYKIITTFHGSDINKDSERNYSLLASRLSSFNILVSEKMSKYFQTKYSVIPCGINTEVELIYRSKTRREKGWAEEDFVILFSSSFKRKEKDPEFAFEVINKLKKTSSHNIIFLELDGYNRHELTCLMQAADVLLLCSEREGSPQVIKESIVNSLPVVANDVGDVKRICEGVDNCFVLKKDVDIFVSCLSSLAIQKARVKNRWPVIEKYNNEKISKRIFHIYTDALG